MTGSLAVCGAFAYPEPMPDNEWLLIFALVALAVLTLLLISGE